jgi:hypothetical protein
MPCYQSTNLPAGGSTTGRIAYATEQECLEACKEGACCTGTTCSVRPQCQCQGAGQTFKGIGTTCTPNPCVGPCCVAGVCSLKTVAECASLGGTMQSGTACSCFTCGTRPVGLSVTIEQTYSTDAFSYTFAPHYGTMMPYVDESVPPSDFNYATHRYETTCSGGPVCLAINTYARLKFVGNYAEFVFLQLGNTLFDPSISYPFYGCTVRGSVGGPMYSIRSLQPPPYYGRIVFSESCDGKTKDSMWDWLIGKVLTGDTWTGEYCYLDPTAHDRVQTTVTINSVQYL